VLSLSWQRQRQRSAALRYLIEHLLASTAAQVTIEGQRRGMRLYLHPSTVGQLDPSRDESIRQYRYSSTAGQAEPRLDDLDDHSASIFVSLTVLTISYHPQSLCLLFSSAQCISKFGSSKLSCTTDLQNWFFFREHTPDSSASWAALCTP
jgi:hypothetical protein